MHELLRDAEVDEIGVSPVVSVKAFKVPQSPSVTTAVICDM